MASFPTACQSGDLRAGRQADRSAGACGLTCAPCDSPGANCCCNRSAMAGSRASAGSTPASTPRTTARNSRSVADEHRPALRTHRSASVMVFAAVSPVGYSRLVFVYPRAWKSTRRPTSRPDHTWAGAEAVGWGYPRRKSPDILAGRGERKKAILKKCHFFITKDQWPPSSTDMKPMGV